VCGVRLRDRRRYPRRSRHRHRMPRCGRVNKGRRCSAGVAGGRAAGPRAEAPGMHFGGPPHRHMLHRHMPVAKLAKGISGEHGRRGPTQRQSECPGSWRAAGARRRRRAPRRRGR